MHLQLSEHSGNGWFIVAVLDDEYATFYTSRSEDNECCAFCLHCAFSTIEFSRCFLPVCLKIVNSECLCFSRLRNIPDALL